MSNKLSEHLVCINIIDCVRSLFPPHKIKEKTLTAYKTNLKFDGQKSGHTWNQNIK